MPLIRTEIHVDVWVDTNVFLEIISWGDLYDAADVPDMARIEARRLRMQGSLWMAMALSQQGAATMSYSHETVRNMVRQSSIPERYAWAWAARQLLFEGGVFEGWGRYFTELAANVSNPLRDRIMVNLSGLNRLTLITRDRGAAELAGEDPIAVEPEQYAARVMTVDAARTMFLDRLRTALDAWAAEDGPGRPSAAQTILERYTWIWQPAAPSAAATSAEPPP